MTDQNKVFYITWDLFDYAIVDICSQIEEYEQKNKTIFTNIFAIPRGGLIMGVCMSHKLNKPLVLSKEQITTSTLIVDECCVSGKTLMPYREKGQKIAVLYKKSKSVIEPDFVFDHRDDLLNFPWENTYEVN